MQSTTFEMKTPYLRNGFGIDCFYWVAYFIEQGIAAEPDIVWGTPFIPMERQARIASQRRVAKVVPLRLL